MNSLGRARRDFIGYQNQGRNAWVTLPATINLLSHDLLKLLFRFLGHANTMKLHYSSEALFCSVQSLLQRQLTLYCSHRAYGPAPQNNSVGRTKS